MKIMVTKGSHHMPTTKSALFSATKDEWDKKEGTGKYMKIHCMQSGMAKVPLGLIIK